MKREKPPVIQPVISFTNPNQGGFLDAHGVPLEFEEHAGTVLIIAAKTPQVLELIARFHADEPVAVLKFIASVQKVKKRIYALRDQKSGGGV